VRRARALAALALLTAVLSACSGGEQAADPVIGPGEGPAGGHAVTVGAVRLSLPASMQPLEGQGSGPADATGRYRSTVTDDSGRAAAVVVTVAAHGRRSATAEGQALVGYQRDVAKGTGLRSGALDWPGFRSAFAVEYDAAEAPGGPDPLHTLVLVASTEAGGLVNVTATAPPTLFESLDLRAAVASVRSTTASG
jgi:hypothetical protein